MIYDLLLVCGILLVLIVVAGILYGLYNDNPFK